MNAEQIDQVQSSFEHLRPRAADAAVLFYQHLFFLDPALRPMFKGDMPQQGGLLMTMLASAVNGLTNLATLVPAVRELGARHAGYGVKKEHYVTVGSALFWMLEESLGDDFTPEIRWAWATAFKLLSETMQSGVPERWQELAEAA